MIEHCAEAAVFPVGEAQLSRSAVAKSDMKDEALIAMCYLFTVVQ